MHKLQSLKFYNESDEFIWAELRRGERDGLERIYLKFSKDLFRYGMCIKPNRSFIKDCIQELFIDLWKYRDSLSQTDNLKVYLMRCLSNKISKEIAKEKRFFSDCEISDFETVFLEESIEGRFIEVQRDEDLQVKLKIGLDKLPTRQREVIHLLFFEKKTYEEVSKVLGINVESSYTLAWKAIRSLRKSISLSVFWMIFF